MVFTSILFLLLLFTAPGLAIGFLLPSFREERLVAAERLYLLLLPGLAIVAWLSLLLAELEAFSLPALAALVWGGSIVTAVWGGRRNRPAGPGSWRWESTTVWLLLLLGAALLLSPRPYEYVVGGRDHGVYVNTGIHIARSGGILVYDELLPTLPDELRPLLVRPETRTWQAGFPGPWSMGQHVTGLTIRDLAAGSNLPHAFHLYPALIAVFAAAGGVPFALATTPVLTLLGFGGFFLVIRRLFGNGVAVPAAALLLISVAQVWFTRYPTAEAAIHFLFWGGLFSALLMLEYRSRLFAALAGFSLGLLHLAKLDTFHLPLVLGLFFIYLWLGGRFQRAYRWFWPPYVALLAHAFLHALGVSTIYFLDHLLRSILPRIVAAPLAETIGRATYPGEIVGRIGNEYWPELLGGALLLLFLSLVLIRGRRRLRARLVGINWRKMRPRLGIAILLMGYSTAVTGSLISATAPAWLTNATWSARLTLLYIGAPGLLLALGGTLWLLLEANTDQSGFFLWMVTGSILPIYLLGAGTAPDHFWVIRRYFPIAFPFIFAAIGVLLRRFWLATRERSPLLRRPWVPLLVLAFLGWRCWQDTSPVIPAADYAGLPDQLAVITGDLPADAILLMQHGSAATRLDYPLWVTYDRQVYTIAEQALADPRLSSAVEALAGSGRPLYWLLPPEHSPPKWPAARVTAAQTFLIDTQLMETTLDSIPRASHPFRFELTAYEIIFTGS